MKRLIALLILLAPLIAPAQVETPPTSSKKNIVKLLLTPTVFYDNALVFGYERELKPNRSLNLAGGSVRLPDLFAGGYPLQTSRVTKKGGFMIAADFRFYLKGENKYPSPRGVYMGPFLSYYQFVQDWDLSSKSTGATGHLDGGLAFLSIGAQIGYQFVVKDRLTFDFIFFGPSITNYRLNLDLDGDFNQDEEHEIIDAILGQFPLLSDLIDDNHVTLNGANSTWALGYRFTLMVGYRFGR